MRTLDEEANDFIAAAVIMFALGVVLLVSSAFA